MRFKKITADCPTPDCGSKQLELYLVMKAAEIGEFSLPGAQIKFNVTASPFLECVVCNGFMWGTVDGTTGEAVFDPAKWEVTA